MTTPLKNQRLESLDALRGLDLFLLVFLQPVLVSIGRVADSPTLNNVLYYFDHEVWEGFRPWDLVMPLFLFMTGAAMPFSFAKYRNGIHLSAAVYLRILRRVVVLFVLGMVVQGNLLSLKPDTWLIYTNTLQAIAVGYLIAAMILLHNRPKMQLVWTIVLLVAYWLPMAIRGDYSPEGNWAFDVDRVVLGRFRGDLSYTWVWSSLNFGVTVMLGAFTGGLMKSNKRNLHTVFVLAVVGILLVAIGLIWGTSHPVIKRLWTSSMTLYSGGWCMLLMALFYWWIDCLGFRKGIDWLKFYGMNSITAYMLGEVVNFRSIVDSLCYGLQPIFGEWYGVWLTFGNFTIIFLILMLMYRSKTFLKV